MRTPLCNILDLSITHSRTPTDHHRPIIIEFGFFAVLCACHYITAEFDLVQRNSVSQTAAIVVREHVGF